MINVKKPSQIPLLIAYWCMFATYATGLLWMLSIIIAWQLERSTDDHNDLKHCRWILKSNIVFVSGVAASVALILGSVRGPASESLISLIGVVSGIALAVVTTGWYFYRGVRGLVALHGAPGLPED